MVTRLPFQLQTRYQTTTAFTVTAFAGGCQLSSVVEVTASSGTTQLIIRDDVYDIGAEPYANITNGWSSPDIWCRPLANDGITVNAMPVPSSTSYVHVLVTNKSCANVAANTASVSLYHSKASTWGGWPGGWNGFPCSWISNTCAPPPTAMCGDLIGTMTNSAVIPGGQSAILTFSWAVPDNPACLNANNSLPAHWCLLAHLDHPQDPLAASQLTTDPVLAHTGFQASYYNNIAQRNIELFTPGSPTLIPQAATAVKNHGLGANLRFDINMRPDANGENLLDYADLIVFMSRGFIQSWLLGGSDGEGFIQLSDSSMQVISPSAYVENIYFAQDELQDISYGVETFLTPDKSGGPTFDFSLSQLDPLYTEPTGGHDYSVLRDSIYCSACGEGGEGLRIMPSSSEREVHITDTIFVVAGDTLSYSRQKLAFDEDACILVHRGGCLILDHCVLESSCNRNSWKGIIVKGGSTPLSVTNCTFRHAGHPLTIMSASGVVITDNAFLGQNTLEGTAILLDSCTGFEIVRNSVARFHTAIKTSASHTVLANAIEGNKIQSTETCIESRNDNHLGTTIRCNRFGYATFGIRGDSSIFSDFGSASEGASNKFVSATGTMISLQGCNIPAYYQGASQILNFGSAVNSYTAASQRDCISGPTAKIAANVQESEKIKKAFIVLPNPNNGLFRVQLIEPLETAAMITVSDIQGRILEIRSLGAGQTSLELNEQRVPGIYFVGLTCEKIPLRFQKVVVMQ